MGRRKISIEPLTDDRNRTVTFTKRKAGLFKKAHELSILCEVDIAVIIIGRNHKIYEYSSNDTEKILDRYESHLMDVHERKRPENFGNYKTTSRILDDSLIKGSSSMACSDNSGRTNSNYTKLMNKIYPSNVSTRNQRLIQAENKKLKMIGNGDSQERGDSGGNGKRNDDDYDDNYDDDDDDDRDDDDRDGDDRDGDGKGKAKGNGEHAVVKEGAEKKIIVKREKEDDDVGHYVEDGEDVASDDSDSQMDTVHSSYQHGNDSTITNNETSIIMPSKRTRSQDSNNVLRSSKRMRKDDPLKEQHAHADSHDGNPSTPTARSSVHSASASVTPYRNSSITRKKCKDNKRPTLSLQIPSADLESKQQVVGSMTTAEGTISTKSNPANKELEKERPENITLPSPIFSQIPSVQQQQALMNLNGGTPFPSALYKDRKNLYTPISSSFLTSLNVGPATAGISINGNGSETPINNMNFFNFVGQSPSQLLTPSIPVPPPLTSMSTSENLSLERKPSELKNILNSNGNMNEMLGQKTSRPHPLNLQFQIPSTGLTPGSSQPLYSIPLNSATSAYFPQTHSQMRIPTQPRLSHTNISLPHTNASSVTNPSSNSLNTDDNTTNSNMNSNNRSGNNSATNIAAMNNISSNHNTTNNSSGSSGAGTVSGTELPNLSGELSALPSKYMDINSPINMFSGEWSIPIGSTPTTTTSHPLPLVGNKPSLAASKIGDSEKPHESPSAKSSYQIGKKHVSE